MDTGPDPIERGPQLSRSSQSGGGTGSGPGTSEGGGGGVTTEEPAARPEGGRSVREALFPTTGPWWNRWRLPLGLIALGLALVAIVLALFVFFYATGEVPPPDELAVPEPSVVVSAQDEEVTTLDPSAVRGNVQIEELPEHIPNAILAAEDRRFYDHGGFDSRGILRAAWANVTAGEVEQGASTITQQLANIAIMEEDADRNTLFKMQEIALALRIEQQYEKEEILELYVNGVPFGRNAIGVEAAAMTYYQKPANQLDVNEAALIAGIIAAPTAWDPVENPDRADERRVFVLEGMAEQGWLERNQAESIIEAGMPELDVGRAATYGPEGYYVDAVQRQVEEIFEDDPDRDIFEGLRVHTHMDQGLQELAQDIIASRTGGAGYDGALVSMNPENGAVVALVGGADYNEQQFNAAVQGLRQPGSAFKTFGLLGFLDAGNSPDSRYSAPSTISVDFGPEYGGSYEVSNFGDSEYGSQTVREATESSTNTVYIQMAEEIGPEAVREAAIDAGINDHDVEPHASLILGTASVSVINMAEAYATLAAEGVHHEPQLISRIDDLATGETIWQPENAEGEEAIDPNVANAVTDVLTGVITDGTGTDASIGRPAAGKTGTTDDNRDAWFVGYVPQLVTAVWIGNLDNTPMGDITGGDVPAPIWREFMSQATAGMESMGFSTPDLAALRTIEAAPEEDSDDGDEPEPVEPEPAEPEPIEPEPQEPPEPEGPNGENGEPAEDNGGGNGGDDGATGTVGTNASNGGDEEDDDGGDDGD
jgi:penicillin-binding protein 1A